MKRRVMKNLCSKKELKGNHLFKIRDDYGKTVSIERTASGTMYRRLPNGQLVRVDN
jgi:hypothetical protein